MIPVELRINSISCVSFISFSLFCPLQLCLPAGLDFSAALSSCQSREEKKAPKQVQNWGPHRPPQWKADGGFFWRQPAAVSSPGEETSHSVSSIIGPGSRRRRRTGGGQTVRGLTPDVWPLSNVFALAHSWLTLERTCENRQHVHALRTVKLFLPFINFIPFSSRSHDKVIPVFVFETHCEF